MNVDLGYKLVIDSIITSKITKRYLKGNKPSSTNMSISNYPPSFSVSRDCVVTEWTLWTAPNRGGRSERTRDVQVAPLHGGKQCPPLKETRRGKKM